MGCVASQLPVMYVQTVTGSVDSPNVKQDARYKGMSLGFVEGLTIEARVVCTLFSFNSSALLT